MRSYLIPIACVLSSVIFCACKGSREDEYDHHGRYTLDNTYVTIEYLNNSLGVGKISFIPSEGTLIVEPDSYYPAGSTKYIYHKVEKHSGQYSLLIQSSHEEKSFEILLRMDYEEDRRGQSRGHVKYWTMIIDGKDKQSGSGGKIFVQPL